MNQVLNKHSTTIFSKDEDLIVDAHRVSNSNEEVKVYLRLQSSDGLL